MPNGLPANLAPSSRIVEATAAKIHESGQENFLPKSYNSKALQLLRLRIFWLQNEAPGFFPSENEAVSVSAPGKIFQARKLILAPVFPGIF